MTTVAQHIPDNCLRGLGTIPSLGKELQVDERAAIQMVSNFPPVTNKSSPPEVSKKPKRRGSQSTPPPVEVDERAVIPPLSGQSSPPKVSKNKYQRSGSLSTPPPAPKRSSSISVTHEARGSLKQEVHFVSSSMNKSDRQSTSRGSKASPPIERAQLSSRDRGGYVSPNSRDSLNSNYNNGVKDSRIIRSILSSSQLQPDKMGQNNLLKPRDRIRSILVNDLNEDGEDNFEDSYGSSYNACLMKISHGDVEKHAVAVTTPRVPSISPQMSNQAGFDPNILDYSEEVTAQSPVKMKEQLFPQGRPRSYTSPVDFANDVAKTATNQLSLSNPIARAYRQHLMTRMEQDKQLGSLEKPLQALQNGSKSTLMLDQIGTSQLPILTSTLLSKSSLQLQMLDMPDSACSPRILSPNYFKSKTPVSASISSTNNGHMQLGVSTKITQKLQKTESQNGCGNRSILDSVKFFEKTHSYDLEQDSSQIGASSWQSYGTLPHSHRYQQHYESTDQVLNGGKEMRKRAKSINNLIIPSDEEDKGWSSTTQLSHSSPSPNLCPSQCPQDVDSMGELDRRKMNPNEFKLSDYISYHSAHFPKRVQITKGIISSNSTKTTLSQGEVFDMHFVHQTKSVMLTDSNQVQYIVPMNSLAMFSILYDPFDVEKVAISGFHFKTAGAVMDLKNPPTIMASTQIIDGGGSESSLEKGEILLLQGVKNVFHGRLLKVFSLKTNSMKFLDDQCTADFTTDPAMIKMTLPQIYDCSIPLPQKTILYPSNAMANFIPNSLQTNALMLKKFTVSKFVVATAFPSIEMSSSSECSILDLDVSLDVDIQEVLIVKGEHEKMQQTTQALVNKFDERTVVPYLNMPSPSLHRAQFALLINLDPKSTAYTTEIVLPNGVTLPKPQKGNQKKTFNSGSNLKQAPDPGTEQRLRTIEAKQVKIETKVCSICDRLDDISCKMDKIHTYLSKAQLAMNEHKCQLAMNDKKTESNKDQPFPKSIGENFPISSDSSGFCVNLASSLSEESSIDSPLTQSKFILVQGKATPAISKLHGKRAFRSMDDDNDEVFVVKASKPPIPPKPKKKTKEKTTTTFKNDKEPTEPVRSKPLLSTKKEMEKSDSVSDTTTLPLSSRKSWRTSIDLSEYLLPESPSGKNDKPIGDQIQCSSQSSEESKLGEETQDGNVDIADWYSQIEEELTKLYNDSILSSMNTQNT